MFLCPVTKHCQAIVLVCDDWIAACFYEHAVSNTMSKYVNWCFTPCQPVWLHQGDQYHEGLLNLKEGAVRFIAILITITGGSYHKYHFCHDKHKATKRLSQQK